MTQVFDSNGELTPVTVIHVEPNTVVATKTKEANGYDAVVLGLEDVKDSKINKAYKGQFPENVSPKRHLKEFREFEQEVKVGDQIIFSKYSGTEVKVEGKDYLIVRESDILATL